MPESNLAPQYLCDSAALQECGDAVLFEVLEWGQSAPAFAVRFDNVALAYLNRCAHVPAEMDWQPGKFWDMDKRFIICAVHGALYDPHAQAAMPDDVADVAKLLNLSNEAAYRLLVGMDS